MNRGGAGEGQGAGLVDLQNATDFSFTTQEEFCFSVTAFVHSHHSNVLQFSAKNGLFVFKDKGFCFQRAEFQTDFDCFCDTDS